MKIRLSTMILSLLLVAALIIIGIGSYKLVKINEKNDNFSKEITSKDSVSKYYENFNNEIQEKTKDNTDIYVQPSYSTDDYSMGISAVIVDQFGDAYIELRNKNAYEGSIDEIYQEKYKKLYQKYSEKIIVDQQYGERIKVDSQVANAFIVQTGQIGLSDIILIKKDGTVNKIDVMNVFNNNEIKCEQIPNLKNATNVISYRNNGDKETWIGAGTFYSIIDINGKNIYNSIDDIKN